MPQRIINVHTHLHKHQDIDQRVRLWRDCGLVKVCIQVGSTTDGPDRYGNQGVLGWLRKYPDLLLGFAHVELGPTVDGPEKVEQFKQQGFTGLKFIGPAWPYDDDRYFGLYEKAQELGMPILFHTGYLSHTPGRPQVGISTEKMRPARLDAIARAFPDLRMMMAHLGYPEFEMGLTLIRFFENLYGEYSGGGGSRFRETMLRKLLRPLPGTDMSDPQQNQALTHFRKLCFATDNPEPPVWIALNERLMGELELPEDLREDFWWRNAARWLGMADRLT